MTNQQIPGPIFVVGIWRSGTSLLYTLLNQHSQIALTYESDLFLLHSLFRSGESKADWQERWEFWNNGLSRHHIDPGKLPAKIPGYPAAATEVWKQYAGEALYGDKSPNYFDCMQALAEQFPAARFIVIWRDLADTCRSIIRAGKGSSFFAKRGITHRAVIGFRKMKRECDALLRMGVPVHQIQYEEMVQSPELVMQGICWFLEIPFEPRMASLEGADRSAIYEAPQHAGVKGGKIGVKALRQEVLPAELSGKIARYVAYWKKESGGVWPMCPANAGDAAPVGIFERTADRIYYRALRALDRFTAFVYCYAPISVLRRYRGAKSQRIAATAPEAATLAEFPNRN
jgi:hypothetical protein